MKGTAEAYARHRFQLDLPGGTNMGVYKAKRAGRIHVDRDTGLYDFEKCDAEWKKNTRPMPEGFGRKQSVSKRANRMKGVLLEPKAKPEQPRTEPKRTLNQRNLRLPASAAVHAQAQRDTEEVNEGLIQGGFDRDHTIQSEADIFSAEHNVARTVVERYKAAQARLNFEKDLEKLVPREEVEKAWGLILSTVKTRVLSLTDILVERVGLEHRPFIDKEIRQALTALSQTPVSGSQSDEQSQESQAA